MVNVARALRQAHGKVVRSAPTEVTVYRLTYASADNPFSVPAQHTISETWRGRAAWAPYVSDHEPADALTTLRGTVSINARAIGFVPSTADRLLMGGNVYNIVSVRDVQSAILVLEVAGPSVSPAEAADVTPPRFTALSVAAVTGGFSITGTINESSVYRVRYRNPPETGEWATGAWSSPAGTSASLTVLVAAGTWQVQAQPRDAAGNVGAWYATSPSSVTVAPDLGD